MQGLYREVSTLKRPSFLDAFLLLRIILAIPTYPTRHASGTELRCLPPIGSYFWHSYHPNLSQKTGAKTTSRILTLIVEVVIENN